MLEKRACLTDQTMRNLQRISREEEEGIFKTSVVGKDRDFSSRVLVVPLNSHDWKNDKFSL